MSHLYCELACIFGGISVVNDVSHFGWGLGLDAFVSQCVVSVTLTDPCMPASGPRLLPKRRSGPEPRLPFYGESSLLRGRKKI